MASKSSPSAEPSAPKAKAHSARLGRVQRFAQAVDAIIEGRDGDDSQTLAHAASRPASLTLGRAWAHLDEAQRHGRRTQDEGGEREPHRLVLPAAYLAPVV